MNYPTLQKPLYDNWSMLSPDNQLMCKISQRKANWYLNKNLAELVNEKTIRLKFIPNGLDDIDNKVYQKISRENICVTCGTADNLTRHHIVPACFRKHFPESIKSHNHYDVVLLCVDCHAKYNRFEDKRKLAMYGDLTRAPDKDRLIVEQVEDLDDFQKEWREHFLLIMNPQFLPEGWSADGP